MNEKERQELVAVVEQIYMESDAQVFATLHKIANLILEREINE